MGTEYATGYGRNPEEEKMKKLKDVDLVAVTFIILGLLAMFAPLAGCHHNLYKSSEDPRECCQRLSLHQKEMKRFDRYCRVALFIYNSDLKDKKAKGIAKEAVRVCKYVFRVQSDEELLSVGELEREYNKVRHYIVKPKDTFWRETLPCDPAEYTCEEF